MKFFVSGLQKRKVLVSMKLCGLWRPEGQLYHAYEIGLSRVRRGVPIQGDNSDESFDVEGEQEMYERHVHSNMSDVSQPDLWRYIIHTGATCFLRDEVSDVDYWDSDEHVEQAMRENEEIANRTPSETLEEFERNGHELP